MGIQKGTGIFLWGIRPRGTFEFEYLCEFETELENNLGYDSGVHNSHKKQRLKISCYCPFKILSTAKNTWQ
jgi:hypothetical protein